MTLVVAVEALDGVWMGCDSFLGNTSVADTIDRPKWFARHGVLLGYAGHLRTAQVGQYLARWRAPHRAEDPEAYLVAVVVEGLRKATLRVGAEACSASFLLAHAGRVWEVCDGWALVRSSRGYAAIGACATAALHSLAASEGQRARDRVRGALEDGERHSPAVRRPFHYQLAPWRAPPP